MKKNNLIRSLNLHLKFKLWTKIKKKSPPNNPSNLNNRDQFMKSRKLKKAHRNMVTVKMHKKRTKGKILRKDLAMEKVKKVTMMEATKMMKLEKM